MSNPTRAAIYARVSTLNGHQDPELQLAELREFAARRGWIAFGEYVDRGVSGSKDSRPELNRLIVKPALSQFYIHPNGVDAYAMFSWTQQESDGNTGYASDIVLITINPKTGKLTNTKRNIANFPLSEEASTSIGYMNSKGTELYTVDNSVVPCHTCTGDVFPWEHVF